MDTVRVDTHCHIQYPAYDEDRAAVLNRAHHADVWMIAVGTDKTTSQKAVDLAQMTEGVWAAVALHPSHLFPHTFDLPSEGVVAVEEFDQSTYETLAKNKKVVAIGEFGLEYFHMPEGVSAESVHKKQEKVFCAHLDLADRLNLPVIIHCRAAHADALHMLNEYISKGKLARRGVIHCFTGSIVEAKQYLALGFYISFTGIVTFPPKKNVTETMTDVLKSVPLDRVLIETDSPYLTPVPHRGKRNEPSFLSFIAEAVAAAHGIPVEQVAKRTTENAIRLFGLSA